ncbi:MAG: sigma-70 family RNA polymerase sigma factor [Verrucomicrobiota bacterium]
MDEDIATLTRRMASLDEDAYRRFFREYFSRLHAYARKLTHGNEMLAQDITQETLLRVNRNIKPIESSEELWCWLVLLMRCSFIDAVRKEQRYRGLLDDFTVEVEIGSSPAGRSIESSEALHAALKRLRPKERKLLLAKYQDGESCREIAVGLGLSEKAVESRLSRLRGKLKTMLKP